MRCADFLITLGVGLLAPMLGCDVNPGAPRASSHARGGSVAGAPLGPETSPVPVDMSLGWCGGHGVPESVCTRCDASLIARFQEAGDWCAGHGLPESQCTLCSPEVGPRWLALRDGGGEDERPGKTAEPPGDAAARMASTEPPIAERLLHVDNDPFCPVEQSLVRFRDADVARRAGIETEPAVHRRLTAVIEAPAEVAFDRTRIARITPQAPGVVRAVAVREGDEVGVGDVLVVIESAALGEAKSQYIERRAALAIAESDAERAATVYSGARAMLEAALPDASPESLRDAVAGVRVGIAKGTLLKAHAELMLARSNARREERLFAEQTSSERTLEIARAALAAAEAEFHAAREAIAFTVEQERVGAQRALHAARASVEAAVRRLRLLGVDDEGVAALDAADPQDLARYEVRSPAGGTVLRLNVSAGEAVDEARALMDVADLRRLWLVMDVNERDLPSLGLGMGVQFSVESLHRSFRGEVVWIDPVLDERARTLKVRAELSNEDGFLRSNMFGRARLAIRENERALTVPADAVQSDGCCRVVFVRQGEALFAPRKVVLGPRAGDYCQVLAGLSEGERVVTTGSYLLKTEILKSSIGAGCCDVEPGR